MRTRITFLAVSIVLLSPFASAQWVQTNGPYGGSVSALAVSGTNLFAGIYEYGSPGVFLSTNNGTSWTEADSGLANNVVNAFAVSGTNLFAGTHGGGVFLSTDSGTSWTEASTGLTNTYVFALAVSGTNLFAGIWGDVVWKRPLSEMITSVDPVTTNVPNEFLLRQNYPNPFNPSTIIRYGLPNRSHVTLTVFNTPGQQVAVLQNGEQEAGYHDVHFDASSLSSGMYLYRLTAGDFVQVRKLLLVR